jgi:glutamyl-tRNA synthetase
MTDRIVTRFAPSPTGFLHIGGARTALFNWLYARGRGGRMYLRIEDTDRARSTPEAVAAILDGLAWLGLDWDDEPISQYARADRHREVAEALLARDKAYRCYASPEELDALRGAARAEGRRARSPWRDRDPGEAPAGVEPVIRIRVPLDGETVVEDRVQGTVRYANAELDDFVLLRSDGSPTYMLAVVVDDHDMEVTHVIRGDDHLNNAARQTIIYDAMGWPLPVWAHVPLIHGPDGAKLSKRHGALGVDAYRAMGYLPEAIRNYLLRLGWSHGDDEIISTNEALHWFDLDAIGRGAARFDFNKLQSLNAHYMRQLDDTELLERLEAVLPEIERGEALATRLDDGLRARLLKVMPGLKQRAKTLVELVDAAGFLFARRPLDLEPAAADLLDAEARERLGRLAERLAGCDWTEEALEAAVRRFAEAEGVKLGRVAQPLRAALTGRTASPPIFEVLAALGREESLGRLADRAREFAPSGQGC